MEKIVPSEDTIHESGHVDITLAVSDSFGRWKSTFPCIESSDQVLISRTYIHSWVRARKICLPSPWRSSFSFLTATFIILGNPTFLLHEIYLLLLLQFYVGTMIHVPPNRNCNCFLIETAVFSTLLNLPGVPYINCLDF